MQLQKTPSGKTVLLSIALAGLAGEIAFELYAWIISPILFGAALQPSNLVIALTAKMTGMQLPHALAIGIHFLIGTFGFGLFVWLTRQVLASRPWWVTGLVSGLVLWFVAQGILAPIIGRTFMMGFGPYTQSSFIGHVGMTLIMAVLMPRFLVRFRGREQATMA